MCALAPAASSGARCASWAVKEIAGCWPPASRPVSQWFTGRPRCCCQRSSSPRATWTTTDVAVGPASRAGPAHSWSGSARRTYRKAPAIMLPAIVAWSIRNRIVVVVLAALLLAGGLYATRQSKLDVFPEFAPPQVVVQTEAPGLSATEVEQLVTLPIEQAVSGIARLDVLRSQSIQGLSVITVIFTDGADIYRARQQVAERLAELAGQLPAGAKTPRLAPLTPTTGRLLTVGFTSAKLSPMQLRDRVQWTIRPKILAVRGVAQVTLFGGEVRQFQVQVHPDALAARHLTLTDVVEATRQASGIRGAGFLENPSQRLTLRVEAQIHSAEDLGQTVVSAGEATPVRLRDVAEVTEG